MYATTLKDICLYVYILIYLYILISQGISGSLTKKIWSVLSKKNYSKVQKKQIEKVKDRKSLRKSLINSKVKKVNKQKIFQKIPRRLKGVKTKIHQ